MAVLNFEIKSVSLPNGDEAKAVFLTGSIDASTNQTFENKLNEILSSGTNKVLLVLTNVKYINSTGLGTIVKCVDTFRESQGDIKLVGVPAKVIALFEMLGLLALFETYETIEDAVSSFAADEAASGDSEEAAEETVSFPIQFKHPKSGMGLNVSQPGRFRDPRSGDYFSVDGNGKIEFYETSKTQIVDLTIPADALFAPSIISLAEGLAQKSNAPEGCAEALQQAIDETCSLINKNNAAATENVHILMVSDEKKIQLGFVTNGQALNAEENDPCILAVKAVSDEQALVTLPGGGSLISFSKSL